MILENMVLKYVEESGETIRIIHLDRERDFLYYVNLDIRLCMPKEDKISKLEQEVESNIAIGGVDPYLKNIEESSIKDKEKEKRDYYWEIINGYWEMRKDELLNKKNRARVFNDIAEKYEMSVVKVKRLFNRFWQRGMSKNALLSDYENSGGKGKNKKLSDKKIGRPKSTNYYGNSDEGINITDHIKKQFEIGINKYYRTSRKNSLTETYDYILRDFFSDKYKEDNEIKHKVWDKSRIPTYNQFYYWFKKLEDPKKDIIFRESTKEFELKHRPILSNSTIETNGPGTRFQIDATIADVYLVSSLARDRIIGRPIVYVIIDVFSRLITGCYVGLEGPSWIGAMMALDNMVCDKVEYCKKHGISIKEEQWPSKHLPEIIIADRGEFEGYSVENLINNLNIKIENTSPYRGDLKGIVERNFRTVNGKIKHKAPGAIQKEFRQRGDRDYRLDALLTLDEFTRVFIKMVLHHNNKIIEKYPMEKEMLADEIIPTPIQLWNWGIGNKKGRLRVIDQEIFRFNILPKGKASISRAGIRFKNLYYSSQTAVEEQWFLKSKARSIEVVYDPRNINNIYIPYGYGTNFEKCYLLEPSLQYKDCILEEIIFNQELLEELKEKDKNEQNQLNINLDKEIEEIVNKAKKEKERSLSIEQSKNKKIKGISNNRTVEKEINRVAENFELGQECVEDTIENKIIELPVETKESKSNELSGNARLMEKLKKKRAEKREK